MESAVWGLIGTLIGACASIATTFLTNRNAAQLQAVSTYLERQEKQKSFQRDTLLELQDAFHDAIRLVAQVQLEDLRLHSQTGQWGKSQLPDNLSEGLRVANRRVMLLVERVADDTVRGTIKQVMAKANSVSGAASKESSSSLLDEVTFESVAAIERIGVALRSLY